MTQKEKISKAEARYRDHPNGADHCSKCVMFDPPRRCTDVRGVIEPKGWCKLFYAKGQRK